MQGITQWSAEDKCVLGLAFIARLERLERGASPEGEIVQ
jgi:hypothetical protein